MFSVLLGGHKVFESDGKDEAYGAFSLLSDNPGPQGFDMTKIKEALGVLDVAMVAGTSVEFCQDETKLIWGEVQVPRDLPIPKEDLAPYMMAFEGVVLNHLVNYLDVDEYAFLREFALEGQSWCEEDENLSLDDLGKEEVIKKNICQDSLPVSEVLKTWRNKAEVVGVIEGIPCYYIKGHGIYVWGKDVESGMSLSLWVSSPAYPPGW